MQSSFGHILNQSSEDSVSKSPKPKPIDEVLDKELQDLLLAVGGNGHFTSEQGQNGDEQDGKEQGLFEDILSLQDSAIIKDQGLEQAFLAYLDDLRTVLDEPSGAGLRVIRQWLDEAQGFSTIFAETPRIYAHAALADFARERMAEVALASPLSHVRIQLVGVRQRRRS